MKTKRIKRLNEVGEVRKSKVLVIVENKPVEGLITETGKKPPSWAFENDCNKRFEIQCDNSLKDISKKSIIDSDDSTSYVKMKDIVNEHRPQVIPNNGIGKMLHRVILQSAMQNVCCRIYFTILTGIPASYLNEFCYKFNRKYFVEDLFDRLMIASVGSKNNG